MRIKKLSNNEVSVYLTTQELEDFEFRMEDGVPREESLHNFLFNIMDIVRSETGFDPYNGGRLIVEAVHSPEGMKLHISRLGRKKLTREQFGRVKSIKAKKPDAEIDEIGIIAYAELMRIMQALERAASKERKESFTFVFDDFGAMEDALCGMKNEELGGCVLYRSGARYAIVAKTKRSDRLYNVLSEFSMLCRGGSLLAADIDEGWSELARGKKLMEMAEAVRDMR